jgi:methylthioxylose transferase
VPHPGRLATLPAPTAAVSPRVARALPAAAALAAWAGLVLGARALVDRLHDAGVNVLVGNAPLVGTLDPRAGWRLLPAVALGAAAVAWAPRLAASLRWRVLVPVTGVASIAWAVVLAGADGAGAIAAPLLSTYDYVPDVQRAGSPGFLLSTFTDRAEAFSTHAGSHPPGLLLALSALRQIGVHGEWAATALVLAGAAIAPGAVLVAARATAGEGAARRAAPFVAFAPVALWVATSADALFMGVAAAGVALMAVAAASTGRRGDALAVAGGAVLALALHLSYGIAALAPLVAVVVLARRRARPLVAGVAGLAVVTAAFAAGGFWWLDGLDRAREFYRAGIAPHRPYATFLVVSLAAFAVALGPATAAGLARLRERGLWVLVGGALVCVALADLTGLSKGETERIWLPFAPWVLLAGAALGGRGNETRAWLGLQVATCIVLQATIVSPW